MTKRWVPSVYADLKRKALKDCPQCDGDGFVGICWNGNPDREEDVACECIDRPEPEEVEV